MADRHPGADPDDDRDRRGPRRAKRSARRTHRAGRDGSGPATVEERAYRAARRRANRRLRFYTHAVVYGSVLLFLLVATRSVRAVMIVAMGWGIALVIHYFSSVIAPRWRERLIEQEVSQRVGQDVDSERRRVEDRHVRTLEELSASIAHEIRNPITAAKSLVQQMGEDPVSRSNLEYASVALEELDRVERSISHLLRFAREEDLRFEPLHLADVVASAVETFRDRFDRSGVEIDCQLDTPGAMEGDADKLRRVVINLLANALDALEQSPEATPRIEVMAGDNLAGTEVWLRVRDNGPGLSPDARARLFDPFYTTKRQGTGLGLALARKVVEGHGGSLDIEPVAGPGTEFVLVFPKEQPRPGAPGRRSDGGAR
jgi:signal transduction histidine kinase